MVLMKLAMDGEFRTAITKVMTELKQAGIDVTPEVSS
jgi:biotin operon repressor